MPRDQITIDELLERQSQPGRLLVTIEALPDDVKRVKVTPFVANVGCLCSRALNVNKSAIESVTTTDDVHGCCGKRLQVVEVVFSEATLADTFQQVADATRQAAPIPLAAARTSQLIPRAQMYAPYVPPFSPYVNWNVRSPSFRAAPPMRARFATPYAFANEAILSTEEAALGYEEALLGAWHDFQCNSQRIACEENCRTFMMDDPAQLAICLCECNNDYRQCLYPYAMRTPCR